MRFHYVKYKRDCGSPPGGASAPDGGLARVKRSLPAWQ